MTDEPVCSYCNDSHRVSWVDEETGESHAQMCTHCPTPCERCREGAYCKTPRCPCSCHPRNTRPAQSDAGGLEALAQEWQEEVDDTPDYQAVIAVAAMVGDDGWEPDSATLAHCLYALRARLKSPWVPVGEGLPEADPESPGRLSGDVLVTVCGDNGTFVSEGYYCHDHNEWEPSAGACRFDGEVIAWQPLPAPYRPKGESDE